MASEGVENTLKEVDRVAKKQKACASKSSDALGKLIKALEDAQGRLAAAPPGADTGALLAELQAELGGLDVAKQVADQTKELHGAVSKLGKAVDRHFSTDVCRAAREAELDKDALNQVVAEHLYHEGQFEIGDCFVGEAGLEEGERLKRPYASMHTVLQEIHRRNLAPALDWVREHSGQLGGGRPSSFEFSLHKLAFLQALKDQGQLAALAYARAHFPPFRHTHMGQIQRLMGALCFARRGAGGSPMRPGGGTAVPSSGPYADLFHLEELWGALARDFVRQSCALLGQAQDSPLLVSVAAGSAALPTLLKLATVVASAPPTAAELAAAAGNGGGAAGASEEAPSLPVEIPLGREFVFHSIFACPVSREQSSEGNPPWMLPCGHVMCKQSVLKIAKGLARPFKCPYCPQEATPSQCKELIFPDME